MKDSFTKTELAAIKRIEDELHAEGIDAAS